MMLPLRILPFYLLLFVACQGQSTNGSERANAANSMDTPTHAFTNRLVDETSPYLLQHAHNPVNWYPWGDEALDKAKAENKLLLISIGYSACHWCHVMEHESFEDTAVAAFMNEHFVCIKVDREERPDIDQIYMDAVQLLTQRGGWPLNCFALPDGKPFFGGTYFPKKQWLNVLDKVQEEYAQNPDKVTEYAERLTEGVQSTDLIAMNPEPPKFTWDGLQEAVRTWSENFDQEEGGPNRAPKFPLPNNYQFLLRYAHLTGDAALMDHVNLTLKKIAYGGIYDQVGGGFARYSTDELWKVPHFEKMLYDNGQLVSLYAEAYQATGDERYKRVVYETLAFVARELTADVGAFYSALDADSEGEEGKFYIWSKAELEELLGSDYALVADYYNINQKGFWEHGNYILLRDRDDAAIAAEHELTTEALTERIERAKATLLEARAKRVRPGLDDKSLTSWNAIMLKGYVDAYQVFREPRFLEAALRNARFLTEVQRREDGGLWHS
ncbi:MAG: thioredoxin domain-containing protein, partial [Bacteroidota bacterium]